MLRIIKGNQGLSRGVNVSMCSFMWIHKNSNMAMYFLSLATADGANVPSKVPSKGLSSSSTIDCHLSSMYGFMLKYIYCMMVGISVL